MAEEFKLVLQRVFNNWMALRLAVQNGMGGRSGLETAIQMMEYVHLYCTVNENISQSELENIIKEILDEEFNTVCEDGSVTEVSSILIKSLAFVKSGNIDGLKESFLKMPSKEQWLVPNFALQINISDSESENDDSDSEMEVDNVPNNTSKNKKSEAFVEPEEGWTTVRKK